MDWMSIIQVLLTTVLLPIAGLAQWRYSANSRLAQWGQGAIVAAGRVAVAVQAARERDPTAPIDALLKAEVAAEAERFFAAYARTARRVGGTVTDATTRIQGEAGRLLMMAGQPPVFAELGEVQPDDGFAAQVAERVAERLRPSVVAETAGVGWQ